MIISQYLLFFILHFLYLLGEQRQYQGKSHLIGEQVQNVIIILLESKHED